MTRKLLLSVLVIGAVVAAVGLVTFAIFSDNVPSDKQVFTAGTVDINVDGYEEDFETLLDMGNMEPGDCSYDQVTVNNVGTLDVDLWNWIYTWGNLFGCDPNPACNMSVSKALVGDSDGIPDHIENRTGFETYDLTACLPLCAGNNCQGLTGNMRLFFHAVQDSNLDGWGCVKLEDKDTTWWVPDPTTPRHGNKCYEEDTTDGDVDFVINAYDMTANMPMQLMLQGPGGCTTDDMIVAGDYNLDGVSENCDLFYRAFWDGSAMSCTCSGAGQGVYAFAWGGSYHLPGDSAAVSDANGDLSGQWTASFGDPCAYTGSGTSYPLQTTFLIKQDGAPWQAELDELDYQDINLSCP